jgi:hypothetical protein
MIDGSSMPRSGSGRLSRLSDGLIRWGVTMITSSVSLRCQLADLKSAPRTGMFAEAPGIWLTVLVVSLRTGRRWRSSGRRATRPGSRPALSRSGNLEALDGDAVGGVELADLGRHLQADLAVESSTVGVTLSFTPNCWNSIVVPC